MAMPVASHLAPCHECLHLGEAPGQLLWLLCGQLLSLLWFQRLP